jgi:hypothetical protein
LLILLPLLKFWCIWICNIFTTFNVKHIHSEEIVKKSNLWKKPSLFMSSTELFLCIPRSKKSVRYISHDKHSFCVI